MNCKECNAEISDNQAFCSKRCTCINMNKIKSKKVKIKNSKKCFMCDNITLNPKFCSPSCYAKYKELDLHKKKYFCKGCNCLIALGWTNLKNKYCTKCKESCKNPNYKDWTKVTKKELKEKVGTFQFHSRIRSLARAIYKNLESSKICCNCGYNKFYEVCHKKPVEEFDESSSIAEINSLDNLIALCPNCHWELDNGLLILN